MLVNVRGEVTETTRANLAVRRGGVGHPALGCGLLPGVARARLVDEGTVVEGSVTVDELRQAPAVATFSSLRGWRSVRVLDPCPCLPAL